MQNEFVNEVNIGNKVLKYRTWKVKDRKKFISSLIQLENNESSEVEIMNALVYDCLEDKNVVLNTDELRYVITEIRKKSLGEDVDISFNCSSCSKVFKQTYKMSDIIRFKFKNVNEIVTSKFKIELTDVKNKQYYIDAMKEVETPEEMYVIDFLFRIKSINDNNTFTFEQLNEIFDEMSTYDFDEILDQWDDIRFKIDDKNTVECVHCGFKEDYIFDDINDFFPKKWFTRK